jgi:hypothetical protein
MPTPTRSDEPSTEGFPAIFSGSDQMKTDDKSSVALTSPVRPSHGGSADGTVVDARSPVPEWSSAPTTPR